MLFGLLSSRGSASFGLAVSGVLSDAVCVRQWALFPASDELGYCEERANPRTGAISVYTDYFPAQLN